MPSFSQTQSVGPPTFPRSPSSTVMGKDDFLKLLVQQLRFQDPLNPLKGTEFAAQLAQFSSVEQLSNISASLLQSIDANFVLSQSINNALAATFIGKDVRANSSTFGFNGDGTMKLGYNLSSAATTVTVKIYNESGTLIRTVNGTGLDQGDNTFTWDGKDDNGNTVPEGKYNFSVEAKDANGATLTSSQFIFGTITAVRYRTDGTAFVINGQEVLLSSILEIIQG